MNHRLNSHVCHQTHYLKRFHLDVCSFLVSTNEVHPSPPVTIRIETEGKTIGKKMFLPIFFWFTEEATAMDGATAAERICPWRRSSVIEDQRSASPPLISDPSNTNQT